MARPKYAAGEAMLRERIENAFLALLDEHPADEITVKMIVAQVQCTRRSFYYHFDHMDHLIDSLVEKCFPKEFPHILLSNVLFSNSNFDEAILSAELNEKLENLCLLVGPNTSISIVNKVKQAILFVWFETLGLDKNTLSQEAATILEFMVNGVTGVMAYKAKLGRKTKIASCFGALFPDIPRGIIKRLSLYTKCDLTNFQSQA